MRVTSEMMTNNSLRRLSTRLASYEKTQTKLATGRRYQVTSEDVGSSVRAQSLRSSMRLREQEARNAADARSWLDIADNQLQSAVSGIQRLRDLAVRGATSIGPDEDEAIALEMESMREQLLSVANFTYRDRPLFGGHSADLAVTRNPWTADPSPGKVERRVGDHDLVQVNVTAHEVFGFGRAEGDLFTALDDMIANLRNGDHAAVGEGITRLDAGRSDLTAALATIGSRTNWVDSALQRSEGTLHTIRTELSQVEDVDVAEAIMDLQVQEVAYQATLQAMARALPPSLASFLR